MRVLGAVGAMVLAVGLVAGCGGGDESSAGAEAPATTEVTTEAAATSTEPAYDAELCADQLGELHDALTDLDSRLSVGLNFSDYSERVGDIRVAYDKLDVADLDPACTLVAGVQLEKATNSFVRAYTTWNTCIGDIDCSTDSINKQLQREWARASRQIDNAELALP